MADKPLKRYIFASDFDQTLTFNDSGYVLAELVGIPTEEFERKAKGMAKINLVQQGAELAYLLLHDPEFKAKVRKEHLREVGKRIRLKGDFFTSCSMRASTATSSIFMFYRLRRLRSFSPRLKISFRPITSMAQSFATSLRVRSTPSCAPRPAMARSRF